MTLDNLTLQADKRKLSPDVRSRENNKVRRRRTSPKNGETNSLQSMAIGDERLLDRCNICLEEIREGNLCVLESCCHGFCLNCAKQWAKGSSTCPLCRHSFDKMIYNIRSDSSYDFLHPSRYGEEGEHSLKERLLYEIINSSDMDALDLGDLDFENISCFYYKLVFIKLYLFYSDHQDDDYSTKDVLRENPSVLGMVSLGMGLVVEQSHLPEAKKKYAAELVKNLLGSFDVWSAEFFESLEHLFTEDTCRFVFRVFVMIVKTLALTRLLHRVLPPDKNEAYFKTMRDLPRFFPHMSTVDQVDLETALNSFDDNFRSYVDSNPDADSFLA